MYNVVLAYMPSVGSAEWNPYEYGETMLPKGIEVVHPRYAISWRNKWMVNESDIVVILVRPPSDIRTDRPSYHGQQ